jgi:hypothetical protein
MHEQGDRDSVRDPGVRGPRIRAWRWYVVTTTGEATRLAAGLERRLTELGTSERAAKERAYLKSELRHLGVSVPAIRSAAAELLGGHPDLDRAGILALVEALWSEPVHERRMAAVEVLDARSQVLVPEDLPLLERLLRDARTWALVDGLAARGRRPGRALPG